MSAALVTALTAQNCSQNSEPPLLFLRADLPALDTLDPALDGWRAAGGQKLLRQIAVLIIAALGPAPAARGLVEFQFASRRAEGSLPIADEKTAAASKPAQPDRLSAAPREHVANKPTPWVVRACLRRMQRRAHAGATAHRRNPDGQPVLGCTYAVRQRPK